MDSTAQSSGGPGPPATHPRASGLEAAVASAVKDEIAKHGGGGGGGGNADLEKRVIAMEGKLETIEKTMVTGQTLEKELGLVRIEVAKIPFETIKWFFACIGIAAAVAMVVYTIWFKPN